ncbi:MAG: 50S ribosomal protein L13 [Candidatus Dadabacteria bacterium]|nr:MAG: 50S ribosomal protein L13 [Candidatus Dadabacteria bacterium]
MQKVTKSLSVEEARSARKWYVVDAAGKPLGRLASRVAAILRGKHNPAFTPHVDCGDFVVVINADKVVLTGKKVQDKIYYRHTGYPGGIRQETAGQLLARRPEELVRRAVVGMLPRNRLGRKLARKLKVYAGPEHPHVAQRPEPLAL